VSGAEAPACGRQRIPPAVLVPPLLLILALWFLRSALAPFFVAMVLAYLIKPTAEWLARHMGRELAALVSILVSLLLVGLLFWALVPAVVGQAERLVTSLPTLREKAFQRWEPWLSAHPWVLARLHRVADGLDPMAFLQGLKVAGVGLLGWLLELMTLILVPVILFYLLVEGPRLVRWVDDLVPVRYRQQVLVLAEEINRRLGGYIRGELAVMAAMSVLQGLGFQLLGVPYAWLLGLLAGISNVVPYSPYLTTLPLAVLFSALDGATGGHLLLVLLVFVLVQKTEAFYFTPVWVGRASGLHPLEVLLAIFCAGFLFGVIGLIFAVPLMIICKVIAVPLVARYKAHPWFQGVEE
jgi:predicted PurR-regulated permease PerM